MKIAVEEISSVKKAIMVEIPEDVVAREFQSVYSDLNRRVRIPGFRPGKAPRSLLEKRYAQTAQEDVIRRLVPDYCRRAFKEAQLMPVELPAIEDIQLKKDAPLTFKATVEIQPTFELANYFGSKIPCQPLTLQEADVDRALQALREKRAILENHPADHAIEEKDYVVIDFQGLMDGKPFEGGSHQGVLVEIGSNALVSGFDEQLIGHKAGEQVEVNVTFPANYYKPELAGKAAAFQVTLHEVKKQLLPNLDDEFAKDLGDYSSLEQLKAKIREDLEVQIRKEEEQARRKALMKRLVELHPLEIPPSLVEHEVQSLLDQVQAQLPQGVTLEQARIDSRFVKTELGPAAVDKVKGRLILEAIADREGIEVSKMEIEEALTEMAQEAKMPPEDIRRLIISREKSLEGFSKRLRRGKALDLVHSKTHYEIV